jgi:tRNA G18 (ribose-2'-O)-methylase SpoU
VLERDQLFVVEGRLVVRRLLSVIQKRRFEIVSMLVTSAALQGLSDVLPDAMPWPVYVCDQSVMREVTGFNFHRGCLALARRHSVAATIDTVAVGLRLLALEGIGNPDNVGGLFRVAGALKVGGLVLDKTSADPLYRKSIRTSMGAALRVPFVRLPDWLAGLGELRARGFDLVALTPDPSATRIDDLRTIASRPLVLIVGSEGSGLSDATLGLAGVRARIPIDSAADSLNVVVAAAIALHTLRPSE